MKVALVHDFLVRAGGAENVLACFAELFPDAPIYTTFVDKKVIGKRFPELLDRIRPLPEAQRLYNILSRIPGIGKIASKLFLPLMGRYIENIPLMGYDLVIANSTAWAHGIVPQARTKMVCYMHSPMRFVWDWFQEYKRELGAKDHTHWKNILLTHLLGKARMWDQVALKKESLLLCNSDTVRQRIKKFYKRNDAIVIYPPVDVSAFQAPRSSHPPHKDFFLFTGALTKFKRVDLIVELCNKLKRKLIVVGDGPEKESLLLRAGPTVEIRGFCSDAEKRKLFQDCRAFIFPTEDDFGIVPLEAMSCGKPVIAFGKGGARETVIPGITGVLFEEQTIESMEKGLARFYQIEDSFNALTIRKHAQNFSKERFMKEIKSVLRKELNIIVP